MITTAERNQEIFKAITEKGWAFYYRGPAGTKISHDETYRRGPVDSLENGILYVILPRVDNPTSKDVIDRFFETHQPGVPTIMVPRTERFSDYGRFLYQSPAFGETEALLLPGQVLTFIGIELQYEEVRILSPQMSYMPYDVFQASLQFLQDISKSTTIKI